METAWLLLLVGLVAIAAGTTASVVGFGIGSLLTPVIAWRYGTDVAVAAVALPHLAGGMLRGWRLRSSIDRHVVLTFGMVSMIGALAGALLFARSAPSLITRVLGVLLILTAVAGLTGWTSRWQPRSFMVWPLGGLSGFFGGIVGNQGGLRAAGLFQLQKDPTVFVATSTVIGVMIDFVRTPIYLHSAGSDLVSLWPIVAVGIIGVIAGTLAGERLLLGLSRERFKVIVSCAIGLLGIWFLLQPV